MVDPGTYLCDLFSSIAVRCDAAIHVEFAGGRLLRTAFDEARWRRGEIAMLYPPNSGDEAFLVDGRPFASSEELETLLARSAGGQPQRFRYTEKGPLYSLTPLTP